VLVGLARAITVRPKLLVVDDLPDALGTSRTLEAGALLNSFAHEYGFGVLFSVSDLDAAIMADRAANNYRLRDLRIVDHADALFPGDRAIRNACLTSWLSAFTNLSETNKSTWDSIGNEVGYYIGAEGNYGWIKVNASTSPGTQAP